MEPQVRTVANIIEPQALMEGAGVRVERSIATRTLNYLDPFLLLDNFAASDPADYSPGFPLHPHRGIETVTYVLQGAVHHRDTLGNAGSIGAGDLQWMTAGRGIMHEEMPQVRPEGISGFQLWVNLPAKHKMIGPRYQDLRADAVPEFRDPDGALVKVIAGEAGGVVGPISEIAAEPLYLDVALPPHTSFRHSIPRGHTAFAYLFEGAATFGAADLDDGNVAHAPRLIVFNDGDYLRAFTRQKSARFLLVAGEPLHEPVARYGPFVMNTKEEIQQALDDLRRGTFVAEAGSN